MSRCILITGATGAIGSALALEYAYKNVTLFLQGRNEDSLKKLARECELRGAQVFIKKLDMQDVGGTVRWVQEVTTRSSLSLVVINAGVNSNVISDVKLEAWKDAESILDVNLKAAIAITHAVLPSMQEQKSGQIALVSSLAGYFGLPITPTYSASKAGLKAYGEALRGLLAQSGIKVNVIMPGYVQSPMCSNMFGPKPFLMLPEKAAKIIKNGLKHNKARISFPIPLSWGTWWLSVLPVPVSIKILRWLGYGI